MIMRFVRRAAWVTTAWCMAVGWPAGAVRAVDAAQPQPPAPTTQAVIRADGAVDLTGVPRPELVVPQAHQAPAMDARADDAAWEQAAVIEVLTQSVGPQAAGRTTRPTEVRVMWDAGHLYVRFICQDDDPYAPFGLTRDAEHYKGDVAEVFLDPVGDARQVIELLVSPANGLFDKVFLCTADSEAMAPLPDLTLPAAVVERDVHEFPEWSLPGLRTAARVIEGDNGPTAWIAELAIPARAFRRAGVRNLSAGFTFRANFLRYDWQPAADGSRQVVPMNWAPTAWHRPHRSPAAHGYLRLQ